jgi:hypothetical protein
MSVLRPLHGFSRLIKSYCSLSALADHSYFPVSDEQPAGTAALATLRSTSVCDTLTRWTLGPILVTDGALVRSPASFPVNHAPAHPVGQGYVIAGRPAFRTGCRRFGRLH